MTIIDEQGIELANKYPGTTCTRSPDGSHLITIPNVVLPDGWEPKTTTIRFVAPVGYPASRPDCFWTDMNLRLNGGRNPLNTGTNPLPGTGLSLLWFSWHVQKWSPNFDSLLSYFNVIRNRFKELK